MKTSVLLLAAFLISAASYAQEGSTKIDQSSKTSASSSAVNPSSIDLKGTSSARASASLNTSGVNRTEAKADQAAVQVHQQTVSESQTAARKGKSTVATVQRTNQKSIDASDKTQASLSVKTGKGNNLSENASLQGQASTASHPIRATAGKVNADARASLDKTENAATASASKGKQESVETAGKANAKLQSGIKTTKSDVSKNASLEVKAGVKESAKASAPPIKMKPQIHTGGELRIK